MITRSLHRFAAACAMSAACAAFAPRVALACPTFRAAATIAEPNGATFPAVSLASADGWAVTSHGTLVGRDPASGAWRFLCLGVSGPALANLASDGTPDTTPLTLASLAQPAIRAVYQQFISQPTQPSPTLSERLAPAYSPDEKAPVATSPRALPLAAIVIGFDGGEGGEATPYRADFDWSANLFGEDGSVASYYRDQSLGAFTFVPAWDTSAHGEANANEFDAVGDGVVHVTLHRAHGWWDDGSNAAKMDDMIAMLTEATVAADPYLDLARYDTDRSGTVDADELAVVYVVAGLESAVLGGPAATVPSFWSRAGSWDDTGDPADVSPLRMDGVRLDRCIALAETMWHPATGAERVGVTSVAVHELGHYLGLPDLYDTYYNAEQAAALPWGAWKVNDLSALAEGYQGSTGDPADPASELSPVSLDAWSRFALGWATPTVVTQSGTYELRSENAPGGYASLLVPTTDPRAYLLLENRVPEGHDRSLGYGYAAAESQGGVVVWLVDKDRFLESSFWNNVNVAPLRPSVMPVYPERDEAGAYTLSYAGTAPDLGQPFWVAGSTQARFGTDFLEPLLYGEGDASNDPAARRIAGVRLRFEDGPGQVAHVSVTLDDTAGTAGRDYPLADAWTSRSSALGKAVCASFMEETVARVALVSAGTLQAGLPVGRLTFADLYAVLPSDATLGVYEIDGADLKSLLERNLSIQLALSQAGGAEGAGVSAADLLSVGGLVLTVDWNQPEGRRITAARRANGTEVDFAEPASLALCSTDLAKVDVFPELERLRPYEESLWGMAGEALRSLVVRPEWERLVDELVG